MSSQEFSAESPFANLEPASVWMHFANLCRIPRASKQEGPLVDFLRQWASAKRLDNFVDAAGNLIIRKPASPGREQVPGIVLQSHLDMVCQKNSATVHDFSRDPIKPVRHGNLIVAEDTTLGADNGIGVALILALLEDDALVHGPLEALLTVDEEAGMGGAQNLPTDVLHGKYMLNLDTETWGEFYLGCAGGIYVDASRSAAASPMPAGWQAARIEIAGLRGGHSGINIHEGRGNAIKLLTRILCNLETRFPLRLSSFTGGTAPNALPREASAVIALEPAHLKALEEALAQWQTLLRHELRGADDGIRITSTPAQADVTLPPAEQQIWLQSLHAAPHGVKRMSVAMPGNVETSNNLGIIELQAAGGHCNFMARSTLDSACETLADEIVSLFALSGTSAVKQGYYPGWTPNPDSPLLAQCQAVYTQEFGGKATTQVIHAGLECGIIGAKYPALDIVSFGPNIHNPHAPGESVEIESVAQSWQLLKAIVQAVK